MKVLFLNSPEPNQGDFYFQGLRSVIGESVVEYPYKPSYHCALEDKILVGRDLNGKTVLKEDRETQTINYAYARYPVPKNFTIIDHSKYRISGIPKLGDYDAVVCASLRDTIPQVVKRIFGNLANPKHSLFVIDGEDDPFLRTIFLAKSVACYFKREILLKIPTDPFFYVCHPAGSLFIRTLKQLRKRSIDYISTPFSVALHSNSNKIIPLNLTVPESKSVDGDKEYDISFVANPTSALRIRIYNELRKIAAKHNLKAFLRIGSRFGQGLKWPDYQSIIRRSKLSISLPGAAFDTYRYWEIPSLGSCLVSLQPWISIPNNFEDGRSALIFRNFSDLEEKIVSSLADGTWRTIAAKGLREYQKYHTPEMRARQILQRIHQNDTNEEQLSKKYGKSVALASS